MQDDDAGHGLCCRYALRGEQQGRDALAICAEVGEAQELDGADCL